MYIVYVYTYVEAHQLKNLHKYYILQAQLQFKISVLKDTFLQPYLIGNCQFGVVKIKKIQLEKLWFQYLSPGILAFWKILKIVSQSQMDPVHGKSIQKKMSK